MDIYGIFRCKARGENSLYNFLMKKIARVDGKLVWVYINSFDSQPYDFTYQNIPLIRDLTGAICRSEPLPYVEGDL